MKTFGLITVLGIALSGAFSGCSTSRRSPFVAPEDARINIEVINHGFQDATLHALWSNQRIRLGTVSGTRTANYMVPWTFSDLLRIEIDLLAGETCITRPIMTDPGDIILLEIDSRLASDPDCLRNDRAGFSG
jgi:hypothetical protein